MASVLIGGNQAIRAYVRGAPEVLLERATCILRGGKSEPLHRRRSRRHQQPASSAGLDRRSMRVIGLASNTAMEVLCSYWFGFVLFREQHPENNPALIKTIDRKRFQVTAHASD